MITVKSAVKLIEKMTADKTSGPDEVTLVGMNGKLNVAYGCLATEVDCLDQKFAHDQIDKAFPKISEKEKASTIWVPIHGSCLEDLSRCSKALKFEELIVTCQGKAKPMIWLYEGEGYTFRYGVLPC